MYLNRPIAAVVRLDPDSWVFNPQKDFYVPITTFVASIPLNPLLQQIYVQPRNHGIYGGTSTNRLWDLWDINPIPDFVRCFHAPLPAPSRPATVPRDSKARHQRGNGPGPQRKFQDLDASMDGTLDCSPSVAGIYWLWLFP